MLLHWFEHSRIYFPSRDLEVTGAELGGPFEDVFFETRDGVRLNAWFYAARTQSPLARFVLVICHGNAGNISHRLGFYQLLLEIGVNVFAFDYRGYGRSEGRPGEEGTYLDAQAAHQWLRQKGFAARDILAYGESLGGGVASELCVREETGGLVLQSTFTSIPDVGAELYPWLPVRWIARIKYDTCRKLPGLKVPVLIVHSRDDQLICYRHAEQNRAAANEPKLFAEIRGDHSEAFWEQPEFREALEKFLRVVSSQ
jgi:uncharacterized protein